MELKDTKELMCSKDYKERFIAEYWQTKNRFEKLKNFNDIIEASHRTSFGDAKLQVIEPEHDCPYDLLREQQQVMGAYLHILEVRAIIECIDLNDFE